VQGQRRQAGGGQCLVVPDARLHEPARRGGGAAEHSFATARQGDQQLRDIGRQPDNPLPIDLIFDGHAVPLEVHILPAQRRQFFAARAGQKHGLQVGGVNRVAKLTDVLEP